MRGSGPTGIPTESMDDTVGEWSDAIVAYMARTGIALTRANYLDLAYADGEMPDPLGAELEAGLPPELLEE